MLEIALCIILFINQTLVDTDEWFPDLWGLFFFPFGLSHKSHMHLKYQEAALGMAMLDHGWSLQHKDHTVLWDWTNAGGQCCWHACFMDLPCSAVVAGGFSVNLGKGQKAPKSLSDLLTRAFHFQRPGLTVGFSLKGPNSLVVTSWPRSLWSPRPLAAWCCAEERLQSGGDRSGLTCLGKAPAGFSPA